MEQEMLNQTPFEYDRKPLPASTVYNLIADFQARGIHLTADGSRIRYRCRPGELSDHEKELIGLNRDILSLYLTACESSRSRYADCHISDLENDKWIRPSISQEMWWRHWRDSPSQMIGSITSDAMPNIRVADFCIKRLLRRHQILRTRLYEEGDTLCVRLNDIESFEIYRVDLTQPSPTKIAGNQYFAQSGPTIRMTDPWLFYARTVSTPEGIFIQIFMNHIIYDNYSLNVIRSELSNDNTDVSATTIRRSELHDVKLPHYYSYAQMTRDRYNSGAWRPVVAYWNRRLIAAPHVVTTKGDAVTNWDCGQRKAAQFNLNGHDVESLVLVAKNLKRPLSFVILGCFIRALSKWSISDRFILLNIIDGRKDIITNNIVGYIVEHEVLDFRASRGEAFSETLSEISSGIFHARSMDVIPATELAVNFDKCLAITNFVLSNRNMRPGQRVRHSVVLPKKSIEMYEAPSYQAPLPPMQLVVFEEGDEIVFVMDFSLTSIPADDALRLTSWFAEEVESVIRAPNMDLHVDAP